MIAPMLHLHDLVRIFWLSLFVTMYCTVCYVGGRSSSEVSISETTSDVEDESAMNTPITKPAIWIHMSYLSTRTNPFTSLDWRQSTCRQVLSNSRKRRNGSWHHDRKWRIPRQVHCLLLNLFHFLFPKSFWHGRGEGTVLPILPSFDRSPVNL